MSVRDTLRAARLVAGRETGAAFDSGMAVLTTIAFALLANSIFMNEFFLTGLVDMGGYFELMPLLLAFYLPAISMRLWAEERKQRTLEVLLTLPVRPIAPVLGKYVAGMTHFGLFLLCSLPIPIMLEVLGDPDRGLIVAGYLGMVLFAALYLAFGSLLSAVARDQIVAFVVTAIAGYLLVLTGEPQVVAILDGLFPALPIGSFLADTVSVLPPYREMLRGVVELSGLLYFVLFSALSLWACALVLERSRT